MKSTAISFIILIVTFAHADTCKYGLGITYGTDTCDLREAEALRRVAAAKSICISRNSEVQWNKNRKEPSWAWPAINAGAVAAVKDFPFKACENADLVVKYIYDDTSETVKINVTDAESSDTVFEESRTVSDMHSDAIRMANHWHEMVIEARAKARAAKLAAEEAERERERQAKLEEESRRCQGEFDSLKQNIIAYTEVQHVPLPQDVQNWIATHNKNCTNQISPELVKEQEKAEADAKLAQDEAAKEKTIREQRSALLEQEKKNALAAWKQQVSSASFVPPTEGWVNASGLPNALFYIILPGTGLASNCHFGTDGARPALDCLGAPGRNDYFSMQNNGRWYLLKSKWTAGGEYAGTVKDGGSTVCLRKAGCYRVLAEVRPDPTELPDKFQVPAPGSLTLTYSNDDFSFSYPQNWKTEERKNKDNTIGQISVAPPEGHLGTWVTHGFFIGHATKMASNFPQTLEGAYDQFATVQRQRGLVITDAKTIAQVGDAQAKVGRYTSSSVLTAGESGWISVVKDKNDGFYWVIMFYPSNDDSQLYGQTFGEILKSIKFKK